MATATGKDTHECRFTRTTLSPVGLRHHVFNQIEYAVALALTVSPQGTAKTKDKIGKAVVEFHLFLRREFQSVVYQLLLSLPLLIGKATQHTQGRP